MAGAVVSATVAAAPLVFNPGDGRVQITGHLAFLDDPGRAISFAEAISAWQEGRFQPLPGALNRGYTGAGTWLHLPVVLSGQEEEPLLLDLRPPYVDRVDIWVQEAAAPLDPSAYRRYALGDHAPIAERPEPRQHMALTLHPPELPGATGPRRLNLFIYLSSTSTVALEGAVYSLHSYQRHAEKHAMLQGAYVAVTMALALINALLAWRLRDSVYGYYAAYLVALAIGYAAIEGLFNPFLPGSIHLLSDHLVGLASGLSFSLVSLMVMRLFHTARSYPRSHRFLQLVVLSGVATTLASGTPLFRQFAQVHFFLGLLFLVLAFAIAWVRMRAGDSAGRLFVIAFSASFVGGVLSFSRILGLVPSSDLTYYAVQLSSLAHMILMTPALAERVLAAEKAARNASRDAEQQAIALIDERTAELAQSKLALEQTLAREQQLRREQADFINTISHEYRTPLAIIKTNLDVLRLQGAVEGERFERMKLALRRLSAIFNDALATHRMGRPPTARLEVLDLRDLLQGAIAEFRLVQPDCPVHLEPGEDPALVRADRRVVKLVLMNLLQNAGKYMQHSAPGARIDTWLVHEPEQIALHVANPIDPALELDRARLTEWRYRAPAHRDSDQSGQGLGLYMVKRGVEDMDGRFEIAEGPGDRFEAIVRLPRRH